MKRRITLSIALALIVLSLTMIRSDSTANAQPPQRFRADTGMVTLGPNQVLRVTAAWDLDNDGARVRFSGVEYIQGACNNGVCKHTVSSVTDNNPPALGLGEAASIDITPMPNSSGVRVLVLSNSRMRVNAFTIDIISGRVDSFFDVWVDIN